eukprot:PhM_4_TR3105/c0_g1_i1/m.74091/K08592/SENP1; sentrin-specific protease 1
MWTSQGNNSNNFYVTYSPQLHHGNKRSRSEQLKQPHTNSSPHHSAPFRQFVPWECRAESPPGSSHPHEIIDVDEQDEITTTTTTTTNAAVISALTDEDLAMFRELSIARKKKAPALQPHQKQQQHIITSHMDRVLDGLFNNVVTRLVTDMVVGEISTSISLLEMVLADTFLTKMVMGAVEEATKVSSTFRPRGLFKSYRALLERTAGAARFHFFLFDRCPTHNDEDMHLFNNTIYSTGRKGLNADAIVVSFLAYSVTRRQMQCLKPREWLNDQIINAYVALVCHQLSDKTCCFLSSFFMTKLRTAGANAVERWVKKLPLSAPETRFVLVPINVNASHWALGVISLLDCRVEYYDSMMRHDGGSKAWSTLLAFCEGCELLRRGEGKWAAQNRVVSVPQQTNGYDCGVFTCRFAHAFCEYASSSSSSSSFEFPFSQKGLEVAREQIAMHFLEHAAKNSVF